MSAVICGVLLLSGLLLGACAATQPEPAKAGPSLSAEACLFSTGIDSWAPVDNETFVIYGPGRQDAFIGRLAIPTADLPLNFAMAFVDDDRNGRICGQSSDSVAFRDGTITKQKVFIASLRKITKVEADRLVAQARAKEPQQQPAAEPR